MDLWSNIDITKDIHEVEDEDEAFNPEEIAKNTNALLYMQEPVIKIVDEYNA